MFALWSGLAMNRLLMATSLIPADQKPTFSPDRWPSPQAQIAVHAIGVRDVLLRPHPPSVAQSDVIETGAPGQRRETVARTVTVDQRLLGGHDDDPWGFRGSTRR